jgi:hypothetical protein
MCEGSTKKFGLITIDVSSLRVSSKVPLKVIINIDFAENGVKEFLHIPLVIDRDNYIIDGHHRYWYLIKNKIKTIPAIRLDMAYSKSSHWRTADWSIKQFAQQIGKPKLYKEFKKMVEFLI